MCSAMLSAAGRSVTGRCLLRFYTHDGNCDLLRADSTAIVILARFDTLTQFHPES